MADYISREAAIEAAIESADEWDGGSNPCREAAIRTWLEGVLSADVRENVRGKWIDVDPYGDSGLAFKCSECEKISIRETNYCPNCGADMRGEHDEP